jgi:hypothetical protein
MSEPLDPVDPPHAREPLDRLDPVPPPGPAAAAPAAPAGRRAPAPAADTEPTGPLHRSGAAARVPIVAVLAAALIVGGLIDKTPGASPARAVPPVQPVPVAAPAQALSSSWFCAGATDTHSGAGAPHGPAPGSVVIANSGLGPATGIVTLVPSQGPDVRVPVTVNPDGRTVVTEDIPGGTPWIGAIVDIDAGAVAVEQQVDGALGRSSTPCATAGSSQWYFATGATLINAQVVLSLLNPYPTDAVVDLSFTTDQGAEQPQEFQGLVVPPGGLFSINLGDHLRRRQAIATTVTARSGRLVAWKTDVVSPPARGAALLGTPAAAQPFADPASPVAGVTLALGAPSAGTTWTWADGNAGNGVDERYVIYNPGAATAVLQLALGLDQGAAEPFALTVGPDQVTTVVSNQEVRIPAGVGHSAVLQSLNGVPVVAERTVAATSPATWSGLGELPGGRVAAARWLVAAGRADRAHDGWVVLYNPGAAAVQAVLEGLSGQAQIPLTSIIVGPRHRAAIHLNSLRTVLDEPLVVSASAPLYAESDFYGLGSTPGINLSFGVPLTP